MNAIKFKKRIKIFKNPQGFKKQFKEKKDFSK